MTSRPPVNTRRLDVTVTTARKTAATRGLATFLQRAAPARTAGTVTIALITDVRMRQLNRQFRGVDTATDVLSFPAADAPGPATRKAKQPKDLGDIAIAMGVARRQAAERGHALGTELRILALHGLLHLIGYDHEQDQGEMRRLEERLRRRAGLAEGLIARVHT